MKLTRTVFFQLTMTEKEAEWLKGQMQNSPPEEDEESSKIRSNFFTTLLYRRGCETTEE